jgi:hypothetical protein
MKKLITAAALFVALSTGTVSAQTPSTSSAQKACEEPNTNTARGRMECLDEMIATAIKAGDEKAVKIFRLVRMATAHAAEQEEQEAAKALPARRKPRCARAG